MKKKRVRDKFLEELRRVPIVRVACKNCGISHNTVYRWKNEDPGFGELVDQALNEGEEAINDLAESKLLTLINDSHFSSVRFWLTSRHPKFKTSSRMAVHTDIIEEEIEKRRLEEVEETIRVLGLTDVDFDDEHIAETSKKITKYLEER